MASEEFFWQWLQFDDLDTHALYALMALRQEVFVVEQECAYLDADGADQRSYHLLAWDSPARTKLCAYLRAPLAGVKYPELSIGRVVIDPDYRGRGLGKPLMLRALEAIDQDPGKQAIRISAQAYLVDFYTRLGFETVSEPYDEDGIPHVEMLKTWG